jgi:hypothetical protein
VYQATLNNHIRQRLQTAVTTYCFKSLALQDPFFEPDKSVRQPLSRIISGKKNTAVFAFKTLSAALISPPDYIQTTTCPAPLFLVFFINKKSLVKPVSLNFSQILTYYSLQRILPTILQ